MDKIKQESVWNDETQRWRVPDLVIQKTKLPPAGQNFKNIQYFAMLGPLYKGIHHRITRGSSLTN